MESNVMEREVIAVSNSCECTYCSECGIGSCGYGECEECGKELEVSEECFECQPFDYLGEQLNAWIERTNADWVRIESSRMGWRGVSGYAVVRGNELAIINALGLNGEWRLIFTITQDTLEVARYSHDEPVGAYFTITKVEVCRECEEPASDCECGN